MSMNPVTIKIFLSVDDGSICLLFVFFFYVFWLFVYSTAQPNSIRDYVYQFLMCVGISYGDSTFTQFEDDFLTEHVKSVTVCDTELVARDRKVN